MGVRPFVELALAVVCLLDFDDSLEDARRCRPHRQPCCHRHARQVDIGIGIGISVVCTRWSELAVDIFLRNTVAVKSTGAIHQKIVGDALKRTQAVGCPTSPRMGSPRSGCLLTPLLHQREYREAYHDQAAAHDSVSLLPMDKDVISWVFLLILLKAANKETKKNGKCHYMLHDSAVSFDVVFQQTISLQ
ncbi:BTB/POZ domain-containing protein At1g67900-like [Lolium rigidum]|uniref:BTB/POZ domain-containing protein At1g67900-like n=1 Tax=Lolium rigidum TaxID=89674 RepID=UPI001F5D39AF|nr:BTB/POZ domain-containing protein At1g67900-like [Lolium rigidum]